MYFPDINHDMLFYLAANFNERLKWDTERYIDARLLQSTSGPNYNSYMIYHKGRKIPVPFVK